VLCGFTFHRQTHTQLSVIEWKNDGHVMRHVDGEGKAKAHADERKFSCRKIKEKEFYCINVIGFSRKEREIVKQAKFI